MTIPFEGSAFFPGPFPFVWAAWSGGGPIYPVARDVDLDVAAQLAARSVLRIPAGKLELVGSRLLRATRGRGVVMPPRESFGLPSLETPTFVLRLSGEPLDFEGGLAAVYRSREVVLAGKTRDLAAPEETRDRESEERALAAVRRSGLLAAVNAPGEGPGAEDGADESPPGRPDEALALEDEAAVVFWQRGLLNLRDEADPAIEVVLSETLARVRVGQPLESRVRVSLEGNWLDTRLEFSSGELGVELDAIREALGRKRRWVRLSDGSLSRISASIEALTDEARVMMDGKAAALLPAHQLGRIDRWLEENDGRVDAEIEALRGRLRALAVSAEPVMPRGLVGDPPRIPASRTRVAPVPPGPRRGGNPRRRHGAREDNHHARVPAPAERGRRERPVSRRLPDVGRHQLGRGGRALHARSARGLAAWGIAKARPREPRRGRRGHHDVRAAPA